jgi:hypothetical protein
MNHGRLGQCKLTAYRAVAVNHKSPDMMANSVSVRNPMKTVAEAMAHTERSERDREVQGCEASKWPLD